MGWCMKHSLQFRLRRFFFRQKYRFDMGTQWLTLVNFILLVVASSEKLGKWLHVADVSTLMVIMVPCAILGVWAFGTFMDVVVKQNEQIDQEGLKRSITWQTHIAQMDRIEALLKGENRETP